MIGQLTRGAGRHGVTESLGGTLTVAVGAVLLAALVVSARQPGGTPSIMACLLAAGVAIVVARLTDLVAAKPRLAAGRLRAPGLALGALLGTAAGAVAGGAGGLGGVASAGAALVTALVAVLVDAAIGYAQAGRRIAGEPPGHRLPRYALGALSGLALAAPAAYATSALFLTNHG